eukprot:364987-Chlamydomonas_euryale.AAC.3
MRERDVLARRTGTALVQAAAAAARPLPTPSMDASCRQAAAAGGLQSRPSVHTTSSASRPHRKREREATRGAARCGAVRCDGRPPARPGRGEAMNRRRHAGAGPRCCGRALGSGPGRLAAATRLPHGRMVEGRTVERMELPAWTVPGQELTWMCGTGRRHRSRPGHRPEPVNQRHRLLQYIACCMYHRASNRIGRESWAKPQQGVKNR